MDILKLSTEWAKAELFSAKIVWMFSFIVLLTAIGFAVLGKTAMARSYVIPLMVAAVFLIAVGIGLYAANRPRIAQFEQEYKKQAAAFVEKEIARATKSEGELKLILKILPAIAIVAAIFLLFFSSEHIKAISITLLLLVGFLMAVDSNTSARNTAYRTELLKYYERWQE